MEVVNGSFSFVEKYSETKFVFSDAPFDWQEIRVAAFVCANQVELYMET